LLFEAVGGRGGEERLEGGPKLNGPR